MTAPAGPAGPAPAVGAAEEPRKRLHPLSPLLRGAKSLVVVIAAMSWSTLDSVGVERFAAIAGVLAVASVVIFLVSWLNTGYHVVGRELRISDGLLWRRTRAIPLERLQSVEVVRPLLAQLTGLAELRLEVVGGGKTEAPLAYLSVREAEGLRERLLGLALHADPAPRAGPAAAQPLLAVRNRDLLLSQLLTPQAVLLPFGAAFIVVQFVLQDRWSFVAIASTVTAMAGVLLKPVRRVLNDWSFTVARDAGRLRVRYGLLETRQQTLPMHRVQAVVGTWPLFWRVRRWMTLRLDVAGFAVPQNGEPIGGDQLLPVGDEATARYLLEQVLPGVDLWNLPGTPPPARVRWLHPFGRRWIGAGLAPRVFVTRTGLLTRELVIVPYARVQSVRVVQGPIQRRLGLATVYADTAAGRAAAAVDRDLGEAWTMAYEVTARARHARATSDSRNRDAWDADGVPTPTPFGLVPGLSGPGDRAVGDVVGPEPGR